MSLRAMKGSAYPALLLLPLLLVVAGCVGTPRRRACVVVARAAPPGNPHAAVRRPARGNALYDGVTGRPVDLEGALAGWSDVDLVAFGELHGEPTGAAFERRVLEALAAQDRPLALALEFFERDVQAELDAWQEGTASPEAMAEATRQGDDFARTHGPLVEFARAHGIPVLAANAPRRLVKAWREAKGGWEAFRAGLTEEERAWLPEETTEIDDAYRERFMELMGKRGEAFFRSQSLWDDTMADTLADFRAEHPDHRILFVVGGFHVQGGLGTITKYRLRRGKDEVRVIVMEADDDPALPWAEEDAGLGDLVLKVPPPPRAPRGPNPHRKTAPAQPSGPSSPDRT